MRRVFLFIVLWLLGVNAVFAQAFDPRPVLGTLISAFQNCGPPAAYQTLSPMLFQLISSQTGGSGCYLAIQAAGPVQSMQVLDQKQFPLGPVYVVRVAHSAGSVDWFIGFNKMTGQIEYLSFQAAQGQAPTVSTGPSTGSGGPGGPQPPSPDPHGTGDSGCQLYPAMCQ